MLRLQARKEGAKATGRADNAYDFALSGAETPTLPKESGIPFLANNSRMVTGKF